MRYIRTAVPVISHSRNKRLYARRKKAGVCVRCGANPVVIREENMPCIVLRGLTAIVERGRPATRCRDCIEKEKARIKAKRPGRVTTRHCRDAVA